MKKTICIIIVVTCVLAALTQNACVTPSNSKIGYDDMWICEEMNIWFSYNEYNHKSVMEDGYRYSYAYGAMIIDGVEINTMPIQEREDNVDIKHFKWKDFNNGYILENGTWFEISTEKNALTKGKIKDGKLIMQIVENEGMFPDDIEKLTFYRLPSLTYSEEYQSSDSDITFLLDNRQIFVLHNGEKEITGDLNQYGTRVKLTTTDCELIFLREGTSLKYSADESTDELGICDGAVFEIK